MERDQAESLLTSLKKLLDHLKERKVDLSHAPKQNDNESNCMFWTLTGAIRNIWQETEDIIGAELRGTKLLTSTWLHASDICEGKVDLLDYDNKEAFGTESGLSDEMKKCVEEARYAVTTFVRMKKELEQMKKEKASRLHDSASRCFDKLPESHSTLLKDTCSHGSDADQQTKAPNACTDMDIDNDDQMPLVSNDSEITENEYKQLRSDLEKGKIEKQDLLKETLDLLKRYEQKESDLKQLQNESEKVKKSEQDLFERIVDKDDLLKVKVKEIEELKSENSDYLARLDANEALLKVRETEIEKLKVEKEDYLSRLDANGALLKVRETEIEKLKVEKEDYLSRLSQYTSAQLKQDNPNIADLSDSYRPTKLAERFSELYDNEWTDAFDVIKGRYRYTDEKAISSLLYILTQAYEFCRNSSKEQDQHLERILERNYSSSNITQKNAVASETELSCFERDVIHNLKKRAVESSAKSVKEDFLKQLQKSYWVLSDFEEPHVKAFALSCANICWHMVLHSPPLFIESGFMPGDSFSINKYKYYKTRGTRYKYIVWPVLYLHPEGDVLSKGVAEAE